MKSGPEEVRIPSWKNIQNVDITLQKSEHTKDVRNYTQAQKRMKSKLNYFSYIDLSLLNKYLLDQ